MASDKRADDKALDDGGKARRTTIDDATDGGKTEGLWSDPGDGTLGNAGERLREMVDEHGNIQIQERGADQSAGAAQPAPSAGRYSDTTPGTPHWQGADAGSRVGGMGTGTGRGRGSGIPGGVYGSGDSAGTGGMGGGFDSQVGTGGASGGLSGGTGGQGPARRSDVAGTGGGVAVSGGRGSDVGTVGGGMEEDLSSGTTGGMSGGTMGGSRESDLGGGLSGGMRSGTGDDAGGGMGGGVGGRQRADEAARGDNTKS
jgi:hypothetical protein